jgi:hypothetical protein
VRRSLQVGVNPPGHFVWEPQDIDPIVRQYSDLWAADPARHRRVPDLAGAMQRVTQSMPRHWLVFPIDSGKVRLVTFFMLFQRETAVRAIDAYVAAAHGDASGLAAMSLAFDFIVPRLFVWGDFTAKGSCDFQPERDYETAMDPPESILGSPGSLLFFGAGGGFRPSPQPILPAEYRQVRDSAVETLLVSGNLDVSTPAKVAAAELLPHLSRGRQVIFSDMAHCDDLLFAQPEAFRTLMTGFFADGRVGESEFRHIPIDFHVLWGFPLIAKLALAVALLLLLGSMTLGIKAARRIRRRLRGRAG